MAHLLCQTCSSLSISPLSWFRRTPMFSHVRFSIIEWLIHVVTYPNFFCYFYYNLSCTIENILTSSVNGVEISIDRHLLSNLSNIPDDGNTYYLNYYEGLHNINLDKLEAYKSVFGQSANELTHIFKGISYKTSSLLTSLCRPIFSPPPAIRTVSPCYFF